MRYLTGILLWWLCAAPAWAGGYVVLTGVAPDDPYHEAARLLAAHHETQHVVALDVAQPEAVLAQLRAIAPAHVAFVLRPEQIEVNLVQRIFVMSTRVDDDPFVDFDYGFITGATAEEAVGFVRAIIRASTAARPRRVGTAAVWGGAGRSMASEGTYALGPLALAQRSLRFVAPTQGERDQAFLDAQLPSLEGCGALLMGGHGMPWEIGHGPRAEDVGRLTLFPAVAFNYACYTGVTLRYPEPEYRGADVIEHLREIESPRSFALAMIRAGVTGYVAYVNPRPAGPELSTDFERVLAGATLGESRREDQAKILLGYLGFGEPGIAPHPWVEGHARARRDIDAVRHLMLDGATGGILYGDPALRPYPWTPTALPLATALAREGQDLVLALALPEHAIGTWCADPFRRFPGGSGGMARKIYGRFALPGDAPQIRSVWIEEATVGGQAVETLDPVWAIEEDAGVRYLHVKANFDHGPSGAVAVRLRASDRATPPARAQPAPAEMDLARLVRLAREETLDPRKDAGALLAELALRPKPASFDAIVALVREGGAHWRLHLLFDVTTSPGDERKLIALAEGPPLPGQGRWTALSSLQVFDTPGVRAYLLGRIEGEADAGLAMSAAKALAALREPRASAPIAAHLLAFRPGWSGVAGHLLASLVQIGSDDLPAALAAYARDPRATDGALVATALEHLHARDPTAAREAAKAVQSSPRGQAFPAEIRARIGRIVGPAPR